MECSKNEGSIINVSEYRGGFLIRRSSAIRRFFAGFLRCDSRTIMKSFLKKIAREFSGNFVRFLCKFSVNLRAIIWKNEFKRLNYCTTIAPQKSCEKPANRRAASDEKPTPGVLAVGFCYKGVSTHELKFDNQLAELVELTIRLPNCA